MDINCVNCDEPWDFDSLHEEAGESDRTYIQVLRDFQQNGCKALETAFGSQPGCEASNSFRSHVQAAMQDLMGDDMDGVASMMEDFEYMGMLDL